MGFKAKNTIQKELPKVLDSKDNLNLKEIGFLLSTIKNSTFEGKDVELVFTLVLKLQNQYTKIANNV